MQFSTGTRWYRQSTDGLLNCSCRDRPSSLCSSSRVASSAAFWPMSPAHQRDNHVSTTSTVQPTPQTVEISRRLFIWAIVIGAAGSLLAVAYYYTLHFLIVLVWDKLVGLTPLSLPLIPTWNPAIIVVTATGGLIVGLLTRWLGAAGEIAAVVDNIHLDHGRISIRQTPSMVVTSLVGRFFWDFCG